MKRPQLALILSSILLVTCIPWSANSQTGAGGGTGGAEGGYGSGGMPGMMSGYGAPGMGGMGGPGMGGMSGVPAGMGGGMGGMGGGRGRSYGMMQALSQERMVYQRPEGPPPSWLTSGLESLQSTERLREKLNQKITVKADQNTLAELVTLLREENGIDVELDQKSLEEAGLVPGECRGLPAGEDTLRNMLLRSLDAQQLAYRVQENHIQITTKDFADYHPAICYYDMGLVQRDNKSLGEIIGTIENSIQPEQWISNGGSWGILPLGQLLVVRASEGAQQEIERMLARLSLTKDSTTN